MDFNEYWFKYHKRVISLCLNLVPPKDAEDVCSEVWSICRYRLEKDRTEIQWWVYTKKVVFTECLKWNQLSRRIAKAEIEFQRMYNSNSDVKLQNLDISESKIDLLFSSELLLQEEKKILEYYRDGKTCKEISNLLEISFYSTKYRSKKALQKAKKFLQESFP